MAVNETYSYGNFMGQILTGVHKNQFSNSEIIGSCFAHENAPDTEVFPSDIANVTFIRCNLDNVKIPAGATLEKCTNLRIKVFDGVDCIVDAQDKKIDTRKHFSSISFWRDL